MWIYKVLGRVRQLKGKYYAFLMKRMLHSYGSHLGVGGYSQIAKIAKVDVGNYVSFNGICITGMGGGENRRLFSFWFEC